MAGACDMAKLSTADGIQRAQDCGHHPLQAPFLFVPIGIKEEI
jgi:hypothetical protein